MTPSSSADRNLLFGILALQNNFIDLPTLLETLRAWGEDKSRPVDQLLLERGALAEDEHALLLALVAKHLARHGGDAAASLAALSPLGPARRALAEIPDPDVQASLGHVGGGRRDDDPNATPSLPIGMTSVGARFRVLRAHARGNLGKVWVAVDEELHREVALKEIQERYADDPTSRSRFLLEAEVTGGLEHPGIVPVYSLGSYANGRPFYAMRFIRGDSLHDAIRRFHTSLPSAGQPGNAKKTGRLRYESLEFRQLLGRFVDVCQAMAYAHSRGVLHRDLKPGNIMLGKYGETLVVDWGLAKPTGRVDWDPAGTEGPLRPASGESSVTVLGSVIGTPAYMSPEQADGRHSELGPASDVYSLGSTMYELLTGRRPYVGENAEEVMSAVRRGDHAPPRSVNGAVPRALEAVCRKAMSKEPADRYANALALAADVEHWLADEPVTAWREPLRIRMRRWARRHQRLLTTSALALLIGTATLGAFCTAWVGQDYVDAMRRRDDAMKDLATIKGTIPVLYETIGGILERIPQVEQSTDENLQELRNKLAIAKHHLFNFETTEELARIEPRILVARSNMALRYVQALESTNPAFPRRYRPMLCVEPLGILERLANQSPGIDELRVNHARGLAVYGSALAAAQQTDEAEKSFRDALSILRSVAGDATKLYENVLAIETIRYADYLAAVGRRAEADDSFRQSIAILQNLCEGRQELTGIEQDLAFCLDRAGDFYAAIGRVQDAEATFQWSLSIWNKYAEPTENWGPLLIVPAAATMRRQADLAATDNEWETALERYDRAAALLRNTPVRFIDAPEHWFLGPDGVRPVRPTYRRTIRDIYRGRARVLTQLKRYKEALRDWNWCVELSDEGPIRDAFRIDRGECLARAGEWEQATAQADEITRSSSKSQCAYGAARVFAVASTAPTADQPLAEAYAARAVELLRRAVVKGYADIPQLMKDADLDPLRRRPDFADLLWDIADGPATAMPDWARALAVDCWPADIRELRAERAFAMAGAGEYAKAAAEADALAADPDATIYMLHFAARILARASTVPTVDRTLAEAYATRSVAALWRAIGKGLADISYLLEDPDLDPLRTRPDYADLLWDIADSPAPAQAR